jgi:hypothetical protein
MIPKECISIILLLFPKIYATNSLSINMYKTFKFDKNKVLKHSKKRSFWELFAIDKTWPTLDKFYYSYLSK